MPPDGAFVVRPGGKAAQVEKCPRWGLAEPLISGWCSFLVENRLSSHGGLLVALGEDAAHLHPDDELEVAGRKLRALLIPPMLLQEEWVAVLEGLVLEPVPLGGGERVEVGPDAGLLRFL